MSRPVPTMSALCQATVIGLTLLTAVAGLQEQEHSTGLEWLGLVRYKRKFNPNVSQKKWRESCQEVHSLGILTDTQNRMCRDSERRWVIMAAASAAEELIEIGQRRLAMRKWNCSALNRLPELAPELDYYLSAERALMQAMSSALLVKHVYMMCRSRPGLCKCNDYSWPNTSRLNLMNSEEIRRAMFVFRGCRTYTPHAQFMAAAFLNVLSRSDWQIRFSPGETIDERLHNVKRYFISTHNCVQGILIAQKLEKFACGCWRRRTGKVKYERKCEQYVCFETMLSNSEIIASGRITASNFTISPWDQLVRMYDERLLTVKFDINRDNNLRYIGYYTECTDEEKNQQSSLSFFHQYIDCRIGKLVKDSPPNGSLLINRSRLDYCKRDDRVGIPGTVGRECLKDGSQEALSYLELNLDVNKREFLCSIMCCNRGFMTQVTHYSGTDAAPCQNRVCHVENQPIRVVCNPCNYTRWFCH